MIDKTVGYMHGEGWKILQHGISPKAADFQEMNYILIST